jgi:hypothetical protein
VSYLNGLRLHFAGKFQANVSTVNNDPGHFDTSAFQASYQTMEGPNMNPPNGWFNPEGDATFRLLGCAITRAWTPAGAVTVDPVLGCSIADSDHTVPAKLVDLDPEQQLASEIWGLEIRIADSDGTTLMRGDFVPTGFIDIWDRGGETVTGDNNAGATYQSVLHNLRWNDVSGSPFLTELQQSAQATGRLSIKFNVDDINMDFTSPHFMCGRVIGTIGPYLAGEPLHLVLGRQFIATEIPTDSFCRPEGGISHFPAVVDAAASCVYLDLGNALVGTVPGSGPADVGDLTLSAYDPLATPPSPAGSLIPLGTIPAGGADGYASNPNWIAETAGVVVLPLSPEQLQLAQRRPLAVTGNPGIVISESLNGCFVRADTFVYRMSPGDHVDVDVYATQFGAPLAGVALAFALDSSQLQPNQAVPPYVMASPPVATPTEALRFGPTATTDANGRATLSVDAGDPGAARVFPGGQSSIDGQVYGIRPAFADAILNTEPINQWNFVSFLLWSGFDPPAKPTWTDVQPILQQYANLYPSMLRFLNLADYDSIKANAKLMTLAFSVDVSDPNSMPVTRDLSPAKRKMILAWLQDPLPGPVPERSRAQIAEPPTPPPGAGPPAAAKGGKAAAFARRLVLQSK